MTRVPDMVFNEPTATGSAHFEFYGEGAQSAEYIKAARKQLGWLRTKQGVNERIAAGEPGGFYFGSMNLSDGTKIYTQTNDGIDTIRIFSSRESVNPTRRKNEEGFPDEFFGVCGWYETADGYLPFIWDGSAVHVPAMPFIYSEATGISWNADTICGEGGDDNVYYGWIYTRSSSSYQLLEECYPEAISADGTVVCGTYFQACVFNAVTGTTIEMNRLPADNNVEGRSEGMDISADGRFAVGTSWRGNGYGSATPNGIVWDAATGAILHEIVPDGTGDTFTGQHRVRRERRTFEPGTSTMTLYAWSDYTPGNLFTGTEPMVTSQSTIYPSGDTTGPTTTAVTTGKEYLPRYPITSNVVHRTVFNPAGTHAGGNADEQIDTWTNEYTYVVPDGIWAKGCSYDASIVVGIYGKTGFRWSEADGLDRIEVPGAGLTWCEDISADGTTIFGRCDSGAYDYDFFYWTRDSGYRKAGRGWGWAVSQAGTAGVGQDDFDNGAPGGGISGKAVMRGQPDADGVVTEVDIDALLPGSVGTSFATDITLIEIWREADYVTVSRTDPEFPDLDMTVLLDL